MHRLVLALTLLAALAVPAPALAQSAPFCELGQVPRFGLGFAALKQQLGPVMGEPTTCEFADPNGTGDTLQQTSTGLSFWRKSTNTPTFTDGWEHWALTAQGLVSWTGDSIDPPPAAVLVPGQPPPSAPHLELVGQLALSGGIHADVWGHKGFAYVGTWSGGCPGTGVKVIDLADPAQPRQVATLASHVDTSAEDMVAIEARTGAFQGDLLAVGLQACGEEGEPGVEFWDVSDPEHPARLGFLATPGTHGVHELHLFQRGERVFALLAVPHSELLDAGGDFRVVEATDPRHPVQLADWGVFRDLQLSPQEARGQFPDIFAHSASVSPDGSTAFVSYWDAGVILLDITDPSRPRFLGRTTYGPGEEGNAHSVSSDGRLLVVADEDTHVKISGIRIDAPASVAGKIEAVEAAFTARLVRSGPVSGQVVYVGRACPSGAPPEGATPADPLLADPNGKIALVDRGECVFSAKIERMQQLGALAVIVANNVDGPPVVMGAGDDVPSGLVPAVMITRADGDRLRQALQNGPVEATLAHDIVAQYNDWGFLRFYDISDPSQPIQIATFATEHARTDPVAGPPDEGEYSVHNPLLLGDRLYASWFSDGLRILDVSDAAEPREVASFVPPPNPDPTGLGFNPEQPMVWGVYVLDDLVLLSDMNFGLYVLRVTGG